MEDGFALGLVLHGVTDTSQIEERLAIYEKIRCNRASTIQVLSNFGFDEEAPEEVAEFLEGRPLPSKCYPHSLSRRKKTYLGTSADDSILRHYQRDARVSLWL